MDTQTKHRLISIMNDILKLEGKADVLIERLKVGNNKMIYDSNLMSDGLSIHAGVGYNKFIFAKEKIDFKSKESTRKVREMARTTNELKDTFTKLDKRYVEREKIAKELE